jgi:Ca-activated chloride channel family protein
MKFANPDAFWMLLALPVLSLLWVAAGRKARAQVQQLVAARLHGLLVGEALGRKWRWILLWVGLAAGVAAWARPQLGQTTTETRGRGRDVIIMVDVSRSMLANDIPPSRLQRAKLAAEDLIRQLPGDRVGLVAFAGSAFLQAPVTADHSAVLTAMRELDPELIPLAGTNISAGLHCADEAFDRTEGGQRAVVLITDGEDLEADSVALARELSGKMRLFTVGVGSPEGTVLSVPSPRGGTEYVRDEAGEVVQSKLDEARLQELAQAGAGFYTRLVTGPAEMRRIATEGIGAMDEHDVQVQSRTRPIERYQWPLGVALLSVGVALLAGEGVRRKGTLVARMLVAALLTVCAGQAGAAAITGKTLYEEGDYSGAQKAFGEEMERRGNAAIRAFNLGTAAYKNQKWAEAIEAFGKALVSSDPELRTKAEYNLANTLVQQARQGRRGLDNTALEQAVAHYDEALRRKADFEDAQHNRDFVKRLLEQKEQQQQQQKGGGGKNQKDKKDKQDKDKNESDKDKDKDQNESGEDKNEGDNKDSENKDGEGREQDGKGRKQSKDGQAKNGQKPGEGQQRKDGDNTAQNGPAPDPVEEKPGDQKERGELKDAPTVDKPADKSGKEKEAQMAQAGPAKMTWDQAKALMEALRSEDRRVQVWAPGKPEQAREGARSQKTW